MLSSSRITPPFSVCSELGKDVPDRRMEHHSLLEKTRSTVRSSSGSGMSPSDEMAAIVAGEVECS
jgi:hypothetical protein